MRVLTTLLVLLAPASAIADESPWRLGAALGYGERGNPLVFSDDVPIVVDLDIAWFGKRLFFDNGDLGYTLVDNARFTGSLMARVQSDQVFFGRTNFRFVNIDAVGNALAEAVPFEVPDRDFAGEAGVEILSDGGWGFLQLNAYHDVTGVHDGYEVAAEYGVGFRSNRWYFEPGLSIAYKSKALNDYYWGVRPEESNEALPVYEAGDGINVGASLRVSYHFSKEWAFRLGLDVERLNDEAADSPIVAEDYVLGWFAGMSYRF